MARERLPLAEHEIKHADHDAHQHDERKDRKGIGSKFLFGGPGKFLYLAEHLAEEFADPGKQPGTLRLLLGDFLLFVLLVRHRYSPRLLRFFVHGMLTAETAVLAELQAVGIVLLVLEGVVVSLLAFGAGQGDLNAHFFFLLRI